MLKTHSRALRICNVALLSQLVFACGLEPPEEDVQTTPGARGLLFSANDFTYNPKMPQSTEEDVNNRLVDAADFLFLTMPTPSQEEKSLNIFSGFMDNSRSRNCSLKLDQTRYDQDGNILIMDVVQDNSLCAQFDPAVHLHKVVKAHYRISCSHTDLSVLNGESAMAIIDANVCPTDPEYQQLSQIQLRASRERAQVTISLGYMTADDSMCSHLRQGDQITAQPCGQFYSEIQSNGTYKQVARMDRMEASQRTGIRGEYFYRTGDVSLRMNQWSGTLSYRQSFSATGNADLPLYQLSYGANQIAGEYPPQLAPPEEEVPEEGGSADPENGQGEGDTSVSFLSPRMNFLSGL